MLTISGNRPHHLARDCFVSRADRGMLGVSLGDGIDSNGGREWLVPVVTVRLHLLSFLRHIYLSFWIYDVWVRVKMGRPEIEISQDELQVS